MGVRPLGKRSTPRQYPDAMCNISLYKVQIEPPGLHGVTHGLRFRFRFRSATTSLVPNRTSRRLIPTCSSGHSGSTHLVHMLPDPYLDRTLRRSVKPRIVEYLMSCVLVVFRRSCPVIACVATLYAGPRLQLEIYAYGTVASREDCSTSNYGLDL